MSPMSQSTTVLHDETGDPVGHSEVGKLFGPMEGGIYTLRGETAH